MSGRKSDWLQRGVLGAVCVLVVAVYVSGSHSGTLELSATRAADTYYNLLVQGFRDGQLSLKKDVPSGLAQLADPYNPAANVLYRSARYGIEELSYYKGRLYLYFGVTPALILFWPFVALTGHYLFHREAVPILCAIGFLASMGLLCAMWRRYFSEVSVWVVAACALALGLATGVPVMLFRSDVYEVAISCGYMLTMLALAAIWFALHEPERRCRWLAAASVAYGLAVGARPSLLFGAVILLVPVAQAWGERRRIWALLIAATGPIILIGLGLMLYNALRFDSPFEFGQSYVISGSREDTVEHFNLRYLWFNFRVYFLEPARWSSRFPFVSEIAVPPLPAGHGWVETPFGLLTNIPLVWLALAVPVAWRSRSTEVRSILCRFLVAVVLLFGICALTIGLYYAACFRYEGEFAPTLVLLAVIGILGLERALADRPTWRCAARLGWSLLLGFSVAFNFLAAIKPYAAAQNNLGIVSQQGGKIEDAIVRYERALRLDPDNFEADNNLGTVLFNLGKTQEAIDHYERALRIKPNYAEAHKNLGHALLETGKIQEAIEHCQWALRIKPDYADAHNDMGNALFAAGRIEEAIGQYQEALRIKPEYAEAQNNLGVALLHSGKAEEAIGHFEQALRTQPDSAEAQRNWGHALEHLGKVREAIKHYEQALRIRPDYAEAHTDLGNAMLHEGNVQGSLAHHEQALRITPDSAEVQNNLAWLLAILPPAEGGDPSRAVSLAERACELTGNQVPAYLDTLAAAYAAAGRFNDAIATAQKGIELARSAGQPQVVSEMEAHLQLYRDGRAYRQLPTPVENQSIN